MSKWEEEDYLASDIIDEDFLVYLGKEIPEEMVEDLLKMSALEANKATRSLPFGVYKKAAKKKVVKKKAAKKEE